MKGRRRPLRLAVVLVVAYLAVVLAVQLLTLAAVLLARLSSDERAARGVPGVRNFRMVDARLWAGGQPDDEGYRRLARRGVSVVVDLRTGAGDDPREAEPSVLSSLGIEYRRVPVPDGHAPSGADVRLLLRVVRKAEGVVFVHCGAGVGRTSTMQAAYVAALGAEPSLRRLVALGPITVEQAWVVATARAGRPGTPHPVVRRVSEVLDAPRRTISRLRALL